VTGQFDADDFTARMAALPLADLAVAVEVVEALWRERAAAEGDIESIVDDAFLHGFGRDGLPKAPWVTGGLVVCCGAQSGASGWGSHKCRFVTVDGEWVWESHLAIHDVMRPGSDGVRTVTIVAPRSGAEFAAVSAVCSKGQHRRTGLDVAQFVGGELRAVGRASTAVPDAHR
jgi:hypothetical protein